MAYTICSIVLKLVDIYVGLIFVYVIFSWLPTNRGILKTINDVLEMICEPYLGLFRRIIPPVGGAGMSIDFSPIVAIIVLQLVARLLVRFFY